jgi:hypothetical protein
MTIYPGRVVNGRVEVEVDDPAELPEGAEVSVVVRVDEEFDPTPEELEEIEAALEEAKLGGGISADEMLLELAELRKQLTQR